MYLCQVSQKNILIAVSGGLDSMVLLHKHLHSHGAERIAVAHCNFRLRDQESDGDEEFVRSFCDTHHICYFTKGFDTATYAQEQKQSTQEAARTLRYAWFDELIEEHGFESLLTAHHFDDSVETFMMNLMRGTGLNGLTGIPRERGHILRPLLELTRQDIMDYAATHHLKWREDSSNLSDKYTRNRVRLELLPLMNDIRSSFPSSMKDTICYLQKLKGMLGSRVQQLREAHCTETDGGLNISIAGLMNMEQADLLLHELLIDKGFGFTQLNDLLATDRIGAKIMSERWTLYRDRDALLVRLKKNKEEFDIQIQGLGIFDIGTYRLELKEVPASEVQFSEDPWTVHLDKTCTSFPLTIRPWRHGDEIKPLGMKGNKKVSDILIDAKVPLPEKERVLIAEDEERIIWLIGHRMSEYVKLKENMGHALRLSVHMKEEN